ncbi:hypothetical protein QTP70_030370, partial [Hemibagrus guttatus]
DEETLFSMETHFRRLSSRWRLTSGDSLLDGDSLQETLFSMETHFRRLSSRWRLTSGDSLLDGDSLQETLFSMETHFRRLSSRWRLTSGDSLLDGDSLQETLFSMETHFRRLSSRWRLTSGDSLLDEDSLQETLVEHPHVLRLDSNMISRPNPANMHDELRKKLRVLGLLRRPGPSPRRRPMPVAGRGVDGSGVRESGSVYVDFATREVNALDLVYTNIPGAYRAEPRPHLGYSDHISVMLIPAYRPLVRCSKPVLKQVKTWPAGAIFALQVCFECTDWDMFREAATNGKTTDLEEYTSSVTSYISKCTDDVTVSTTITTRPNQKPWMTAKVLALIKSRDSAFRAGDNDALRTARAKLPRAIREAKRAHSQRIHGHFQSSGDTQRMWQGIQSITIYRPAPPACDSDASIPDVLNSL